MKILYFIDGMHFGGAARKLCLIANELVNRGIQVTIATNTYLGIGFPLSDKINVLDLYPEDAYTNGRISRLWTVMRRARRFAKFESPDIIVTITPHITLDVKIATYGLRIPTIFSDETSFARKDSRIDHFVRHWFYRFGDSITLLTQNDARLLGEKYPQKTVISNPLAYEPFTNTNKREKNILAIGPLHEWDIKGFDLLFKAYSKCVEEFPEWGVKVAGKIEENGLAKMQHLLKELNLEGRVHFLDFCPHVEEEMRTASIYALSSRIEGFSLSLVEAISQGCACVAFDNYGVISEVTDGGKGTLIVKDGDVEEFSAKLRILMRDEQQRSSLVESGKALVDKYKIGTIVDQWITLFKKLNKKQ